MILKRLVRLTLPVLALIAHASVAGALTSPSALTATAISTSQIRLSWVGVDQGELSYSIERSMSSTSGFAQIGTAGRSATSYTSSGLAPGTRYYYRVRAIKNGTASLYSNVAGATTFGVVTTTTFMTTTSTTSTTLAGSSGPVANAGPDQFTQTLTMVQFNGLRSVDSGGTITSYAWMFGDGGSASGMAVSHAYAVPGAYNATLTVTDSRGMRASDTATVQVANRPPVANAGSDQTQAPGSPVTFNGAGSSDPDGTITAYAWSFGDGASATGSTVTHSYAAAGTYTATLAVTDNRGARGTDTALVTVTASTGSPQTWAKRFGSAGTDVGNGVAVDGSGNVVMTGGVQGATDFGGGVVCPAYSIFVAKYSAAGAPLWCHCFQGMLANSAGRAVAVDSSGNVVLTGYFFGTVDFGGGPLPSAGGPDIFVAKYSPAGTHLWSRRFGSPTASAIASESGNAVAVDSGGNVVVTGIFEGTVDFGGGPFTASTQKDIFIAKYSATGAHIWSRHALNATGAVSGNGVAVDASGSAVVTGSFLQTVDLGGGTLTSPFGQAIFVTKYSPSGAHLWSKVAGGWTDAGNAVAVDAAGNVVVTGQFGNWLDFGTGWIPHRGGNDIFLAKFTSAGTAVWVKTFGATGDDWGARVAVDGSGNVIITGAVGVSADFGGGMLLSHGGLDIFAAKFSAAGTHLWSQIFGSSYIDTGNAVAVGTSGNVLVTGSFEAAVDFGSGPLTNAGSFDVFLLSRAP